jgi:hypothetical protein
MKKSIPTPLRQLRREALALLAGSILESLTCVPGIVVAAPLTGASSAPSQEFPMKIRLQVDGQDVNATLDDNATARDFAALLPLSLTLTDYARIERIAYLPCKLAPRRRRRWRTRQGWRHRLLRTLGESCDLRRERGR